VRSNPAGPAPEMTTRVVGFPDVGWHIVHSGSGVILVVRERKFSEIVGI